MYLFKERKKEKRTLKKRDIYDGNNERKNE